MPQLSFETYLTQYFWLLIILGLFYFYVATTIVPTLALIKKSRTLQTSVSFSHHSAETTGAANIEGVALKILQYTATPGSKDEIFEQAMNKAWVVSQ